MPGSYRVGVVGFGVGGATVSCLLARDGHRVTLLEQSPAVHPIGAGVLLQMSGQGVLRRLGLLDRVLANAAPIEMLDARHVGGAPLVRTVYGELEPDCRAYGVHRGVLFRAVADAVEASPVEVRLGCEVRSREVSGDGVFLLDTAGTRHGPFDFLVCVDGSRSRLRAACGLRAWAMPYSHGTLWITAPATNVGPRLLQYVRGCRQLCGLLPLGGGLTSMYWGLPVRDFPRVRARGLTKLKDEILRFAPESADVLDCLYDFEQLLFTGYRHVVMPRTFDRHTMFLGDAAHAMSPHLGQGINLAMVDAERFAAALREAPDPPAAFKAFQRRQRAYIRYYSTVTFLLSPFFQSDWAILGLGRDVVLPVLPEVPWVKRQMLLTVAGLKGGFLTGREEFP